MSTIKSAPESTKPPGADAPPPGAAKAAPKPESPFAAFSFDPQAVIAANLATFGRITQDGIDRMRAVFDELSAVETQVYARMKTTAADATKLADETVEYLGNLAAQWRELTLATARRAADSFGARS